MIEKIEFNASKLAQGESINNMSLVDLMAINTLDSEINKKAITFVIQNGENQEILHPKTKLEQVEGVERLVDIASGQLTPSENTTMPYNQYKLITLCNLITIVVLQAVINVQENNTNVVSFSSFPHEINYIPNVVLKNIATGEVFDLSITNNNGMPIFSTKQVLSAGEYHLNSLYVI